MKNTIMVHSRQLTPEGKLCSESIQRVDKGIELLKKGKADYLIMNGGPGYLTSGEYLPRDSKTVHSDVMREHAVDSGVNELKLLWQRYSMDTVGEALYVKEIHLEPRGWTDNIAVTSDYHIERTQTICDFVFGPGYKTQVIGVPTGKSSDPEIMNREKRSLELFLEQMKDAEPGNTSQIEDVLFTKHDMYKGLERYSPFKMRMQMFKSEVPIIGRLR